MNDGSSNGSDLRVRRATIDDVAQLVHQRVSMYRDMGELAATMVPQFTHAAALYFRTAIAAGEYIAWLAIAPAPSAEIVAGAGLIVRPMIPRPAPDGSIELREGTVVNVYTAPAWRRKGLGALVVKHVMEYARYHQINRLSLHASDDGRPLYETLGFAPTNEMRLKR